MAHRTIPLAVAALVISMAGLPAHAQTASQTIWPNTFKARLEALALLQSLNADLLSHDSATETLRRWCADHHLATEPSIVAERVHDLEKPADAAVLADLGATPGQVVRYRHVRLACGGRILSEADNWYLPSKLTPTMNRQLDDTETPFGVVVKSLAFQRRTLSARLLFSPLPDNWDREPTSDAGGTLAIPPQVIQHRAILSTTTGGPFSLVVETYTDKVLPDRAP